MLISALVVSLHMPSALVSLPKWLTILFGVAQLDAAWMAASAGVSVVIASGKAKDGVLQVTAGVTLSEHLMFWQTACSSFHLSMHLALAVRVPFCLSLCLFFCLSSVCPSLRPSVRLSVCLSVSGWTWILAALLGFLCKRMLKAACALQGTVYYKCSDLLFCESSADSTKIVVIMTISITIIV